MEENDNQDLKELKHEYMELKKKEEHISKPGISFLLVIGCFVIFFNFMFFFGIHSKNNGEYFFISYLNCILDIVMICSYFYLYNYYMKNQKEKEKHLEYELDIIKCKINETLDLLNVSREEWWNKTEEVVEK